MRIIPLRLIPIGCLAVVLCGGRAVGQVDPWEFEVLPYATEQRGMIELETNNAVVANGHSQGGDGTAAGSFRSQGMWYNADELTYGLTDRIEAAAYLTFAEPAGHGFWWAGNKVHLRGMLGQHAALPIDLGWYAAFEWRKIPQFDNADLILELKPILEKDLGLLSLVANPVFEKALLGEGHDQGFAFGYRNGVYFKWTKWCSTGIEFYGGVGLIDDSDPLSRQQHYIFPVVQGELLEGFEYNHVFPRNPMRTFLLQFAENLRDRILTQRLISEAEFSEVIINLKMHLADPATLMIFPLYVQAWGKKP